VQINFYALFDLEMVTGGLLSFLDYTLQKVLMTVTTAFESGGDW